MAADASTSWLRAASSSPFTLVSSAAFASSAACASRSSTAQGGDGGSGGGVAAVWHWRFGHRFAHGRSGQRWDPTSPLLPPSHPPASLSAARFCCASSPSRSSIVCSSSAWRVRGAGGAGRRQVRRQGRGGRHTPGHTQSQPASHPRRLRIRSIWPHPLQLRTSAHPSPLRPTHPASRGRAAPACWHGAGSARAAACSAASGRLPPPEGTGGGRGVMEGSRAAAGCSAQQPFKGRRPSASA